MFIDLISWNFSERVSPQHNWFYHLHPESRGHKDTVRRRFPFCPLIKRVIKIEIRFWPYIDANSLLSGLGGSGRAMYGSPGVWARIHTIHYRPATTSAAGTSGACEPSTSSSSSKSGKKDSSRCVNQKWIFWVPMSNKIFNAQPKNQDPWKKGTPLYHKHRSGPSTITAPSLS